VPNPRQETELLICHALETNRLQLYLRQPKAVSSEASRKARDLFLQRATRIPLQYLLGTQEFWGLEFEVETSVLIPRPETEILIEEALRVLNRLPKTEDIRIIDLGTGSGCIAIALAKELPKARILATDLSQAALAVARRNARRHGTENQITFESGDLFGPLKGSYSSSASPGEDREAFCRAHLIISNPPYVASQEMDTLAKEIKDHEPRMALDGGQDGLDVCRRIIQEAPNYLVPGGTLAIEIGWKQAEPLRKWTQAQACPWEIEFKKDLAGIDRVALFTKKSG
jgi:release factor glutamine methyltransferase